jgi:hypothetical protein
VLDTVTTDDTWREKFKRHWLQLRGLGWQGMMLDKVMRQNAMTRNLAQRVADGTLGKEQAGGAVVEDDMGIRIGDEIVNYHYAPPTVPLTSDPQPQPPSAPPPAAPAASGTTPTWLKAALVGAGVAGLVGGGAAIPIVADWLGGDDKPAVVSPDTDTSVTLDFGE